MKPRCVFLLIAFQLFTLSIWAQTSSPASAAVQVPPLIQFSNVATDEGGNTLSGVVSITFSLYSSQIGGEPLWTETQNNVQLDATGHYSVQLGITKRNGVPTTLFATGEARWLGIQIAEQPPQARVLLLSVPYAMKAGDATTLGGLPPSAFVRAVPGGADVTAVASDAALTTSSSAAPDVTPAATSDVTTSGGTAGTIAAFSAATNIQSSVLSQTSGGAINVGGPLNLPATGTATSSASYNSQPLNLVASAYNSSAGAAANQTFVWQAVPAGNDTSSPSANLNLLFGEGTAAPTGTGLNIASNGIITFATGQTFPGTGSGTITGVTAGSGLTGGGTSGNVTLGLITCLASGQVLQWNGSAWACSSAGSGTITGVTAGTDLTGGGTSGSVTLNLDTTKVPLLSGGNNFFGNQTVNGSIFAAGSGSTVNAQTSFDVYYSGSGTWNPIAFGNYGSGDAFLGFAGNVNTASPGTQNTGTGYQALYANTTGAFNTANGYRALNGVNSASYNTAVGADALQASLTGSDNTAVGGNALENDSSGAENTAVGYNALIENTAGGENTALGMSALSNNSSGNNNTAVGYDSLAGNSQGVDNTAVGAQALYSNNNTTGANTATGFKALTGNSAGEYNTANGYQALDQDSGSYNTGLGANALYLDSGSNNTALGYEAGFLSDVTLTGSSNTFIGSNATFGSSATGITYATAIGADAEVTESNAVVLGCVWGLNNCPVGSSVGIGTTSPGATLDVEAPGTQKTAPTINFGSTANPAIFTLTGNSTITGNLSVSGTVTCGSGCGGSGGGGISTINVDPNTMTANTSGSTVTLSAQPAVNIAEANAALTYLPLTGALPVAGQLNVNSNVNIAAGSSFQIGGQPFAYGSPYNSSTGTGGSTFFGFAGGPANAAVYDTAVGAGALPVDSGIGRNTAVGALALSSDSGGFFNTAVGLAALANNTGSGGTNPTGAENTALGTGALEVNTTGNANTAVGNTAGIALPSGTFITGSNNTFLGAGAVMGSSTGYSPGALNFASAVGAFSEVDKSNALVLGSVLNMNGCTQSLNCGNTQVGIGTTTPGATLDVEAPSGSTPSVNFGSTSVPATFGVNGQTTLTSSTSTALTVTGNTSISGTLTLGGTVLSGTSDTFNGTQTINGNISLPSTNSSGTQGVISIGGAPFIQDYGPSGSYNAFVGFNAGNLTNTGLQLTAVGDFALGIDSTGSGNTAVGTHALNGNTTGSNNTAVGVAAGGTADGSKMTTNDNTFMGYKSVASTGKLTNVTAIGANAVVGSGRGSTATGNNSTAIGANAYVTANNTMVLGSIAGVNGASANTSVVIGNTAPLSPGITFDVEAPSGSTPSVNFGSASNNANFTVNGNTSVSGTLTAGGVNASTSFGLGGYSGFASGSSPLANAFFGWAGNSGMTGKDNTAVGASALSTNSTGTQNTANGSFALFYNTGGSNTAAGYQALFYNTTGSGNTAIGAYAGPDPNSMGLTNSTAIGANAVVSQSNSVVLGCTQALNSNCQGQFVNVGINTATPATTLDVEVPTGSWASLNVGTAAGTGAKVNFGNATTTGQLSLSGDAPMSHNPRLTWSSFLTGNLGGFPSGGFFVPDAGITITRVTASPNTAEAGGGCGTPAYVQVINAATQSWVVQVNLTGITIGQYQNPGSGDTGPISVAVSAGTYLQVIGVPASGCGISGQSPSDVSVTVQYVMQ